MTKKSFETVRVTFTDNFSNHEMTKLIRKVFPENDNFITLKINELDDTKHTAVVTIYCEDLSDADVSLYKLTKNGQVDYEILYEKQDF